VNTARQQAAQASQRATQHADRLTEVIESTTASYTDRLQQQWDQQRPATREPARTVLNGPGRFGIHHRRVEHAAAELARWADHWRPVMPSLPTDTTQLAQVADRYDSPQVRTAINAYARAAAHRAYPEHQGAVKNAAAATEYARQAETTYRQAATAYDYRLAGRFGGLAWRRDPDAQLERYERWVTEETSKHNTAVSRVRTLMSEPALRSLTPERIQTERDTWHHDRAAQQRAEQAAAQQAARRRDAAQHQPDPVPSYTTQSPQHDQGIGF
jgi:exodeoxyribonuclease V alpha subunit